MDLFLPSETLILVEAHGMGVFGNEIHANIFVIPCDFFRLTAFVISTFNEAKEYIFVDDKIIEKAIEFIHANTE